MTTPATTLGVNNVAALAIVNLRCMVLVLVLSLVVLGFGMVVVASVTATSGWAWGSMAVSVLAGLVLVAAVRRKRRARREEDMTGYCPVSGLSHVIDSPTIAFQSMTPRPQPMAELRGEAIPPLPRAWAPWAPERTQPSGQGNHTPGGVLGGVSSCDPDAGAGPERAGTGAADPRFTPPTHTGPASPTIGVTDSGGKVGEVTDTPDAVRSGQSGGPWTQVGTPAGPTPEPGQERPEPAATAIVATLEHEVLVVDEHPRYHLPGCRSLSGRETIALPAKDAVELQFTPCEVCTPVQVLASTASERVQASAERAEPPEQPPP